MHYHPPHTVLRPRRYIRSIDVLYDGGADGFSLAMIDWEGTPHIGIRWNVAHKEHSDERKRTGLDMCHGSPAPDGRPSWFILPRELFHPSLFHADSEQFIKVVAEWHARPTQ